MNGNIHGNILVAEDNPITQKLLDSILSHWGYSTCVVSDGEKALEQLKDKAYDLLILDYQMPIMNGLETLKAIQNDPDAKINSIPVILMTGEIEMKTVNQLENSGASCFLRKPIQPEVLSKTLYQLLKNKKAKGIKGSASTKYLRKITHSNNELMVELIDVFIDESPKNFRKMKSYYLMEDWKSLKNIVHKVKANYSYVGIEEPRNLLRDLELDIERMLSTETYLAKIIELEEITRAAITSLKKKRSILIEKI
jgi:CheY-like chemotaxis protein